MNAQSGLPSLSIIKETSDFYEKEALKKVTNSFELLIDLISSRQQLKED